MGKLLPARPMTLTSAASMGCNQAFSTEFGSRTTPAAQTFTPARQLQPPDVVQSSYPSNPSRHRISSGVPVRKAAVSGSASPASPSSPGFAACPIGLSREELLRTGRLLSEEPQTAERYLSPAQPYSPGVDESHLCAGTDTSPHPHSPSNGLEAKLLSASAKLEAELRATGAVRDRIKAKFAQEAPTQLPLHAAPCFQSNAAAVFQEDSHTGIRLSEIQAELSAAEQARDSLRGDLHREVGIGEELRRQLAMAEVAASSSSASDLEAGHLRNRNIELDAELARTVRVADRIQMDFASEATAAAQLRQKLSLAEAMAQAELQNPTSDLDGDCSDQNIRIIELEAERNHQMSILIELEARLSDFASRRQQLERSIQEERVRAEVFRSSTPKASSLMDTQRQDIEVRTAASEERERLEAVLIQEQATTEELRQQLALADEEERQQLQDTEERMHQELAAIERRTQEALADAATSSEAARKAARVINGDDASSGRDGVSSKRRVIGTGADALETDSFPDRASTSCASGSIGRHSIESRKAALFEAAATDDVDALKEALKGDDRDIVSLLTARDDVGRTLLHMALEKSSNEATKLILGVGQKLGNSRKFFFELQGELLEREVSNFVNGQDNTGKGALSILCASEEATRDLVIMLLEAQADPTQRDHNGGTPFLESAKCGNVPLMKMLLSLTRGKVLTDVDDAYQSALHWAAEDGEEDAIEFLLKAGANADASDKDGRTAAEVARSAGHQEVAAMIAQALGDEALEQFMATCEDVDLNVREGSFECWEDFRDDDVEHDIPMEDTTQGRINREARRRDDTGGSASKGRADSGGAASSSGVNSFGAGGGDARWTSL